MSGRIDFVTVKVEPQMTVIDRRYLSALGNNGVWILVFVIAFLVVAGCGRTEDRTHLPREHVVQIYADMLFLAELNRQDLPAYRRAIDSMCRAHGVDTAQLGSNLRWYTRDEKETGLFYDEVLKRLDRRSRSASGKR
jgi:hypothetical protein